jgi:hypothetical protein
MPNCPGHNIIVVAMQVMQQGEQTNHGDRLREASADYDCRGIGPIEIHEVTEAVNFVILAFAMNAVNL